jgi:hypothetical protein
MVLVASPAIFHWRGGVFVPKRKHKIGSLAVKLQFTGQQADGSIVRGELLNFSYLCFSFLTFL